jgi:hypothetical protein
MTGCAMKRKPASRNSGRISSAHSADDGLCDETKTPANSGFGDLSVAQCGTPLVLKTLE